MVESDRISSNELLHPVLPVTVPLTLDPPHGAVAGGHGGRGLVGLPRGAVEGHHPVVRVLQQQDENLESHEITK